MTDHDKWKNAHGGFMGGGWFLGFVGALVYYIGSAPDFWAGVAGFFKAILWPAFLVYHLLSFIKA